MRISTELPALLALDDDLILHLWGDGFDTLPIARQLGVPESAVANRLAVLRDRGRQ